MDLVYQRACSLAETLGRKPVATARLVQDQNRKGKIARIAILKSHRRKGLAKDLIPYIEKKAMHLGLTSLLIEPHAYLENFFKQLGYQKLPGYTEVAGLRLIKLEKRLI